MRAHWVAVPKAVRARRANRTMNFVPQRTMQRKDHGRSQSGGEFGQSIGSGFKNSATDLSTAAGSRAGSARSATNSGSDAAQLTFQHQSFSTRGNSSMSSFSSTTSSSFARRGERLNSTYHLHDLSIAAGILD
jgi:hypothetical protein